MSTSINEEQEAFVPQYDAIPEDWNQARQILTEYLKKISDAINVREIGWFLDEELQSGGQFIQGANGEYRGIFRKTIDVGALPAAAGTNTTAHGITINDQFTLLHLYGAASDPTGLNYIPVPYASNTAGESVELYMDATNVYVEVASASYGAYTRCYVVIEYIKEL